MSEENPIKAVGYKPGESTMSSWKRLTNSQREDLVRLPIWTTEEDRRVALSYVDRDFVEAEGAIRAVLDGRLAPASLGKIIAAARYEDAGWLPASGFKQWRRQTLLGSEQSGVEALVHWLDNVENNMRQRLRDLEARMLTRCQEQDERASAARDEACRSYQQLQGHLRNLILARLSVGDIDGAHEIAHRAPSGPERSKLADLICAYWARPHSPHDAQGSEARAAAKAATVWRATKPPTNEVEELRAQLAQCQTSLANLTEAFRRVHLQQTPSVSFLEEMSISLESKPITHKDVEVYQSLIDAVLSED